jgi:TolA-binding protein
MLPTTRLPAASAQDTGTTPAPAPSARKVPEALNFANGLFRERRYELAAKEYERFLSETEPGQDADDARFGLANARLFQGHYAKARAEFETFVKQAPKHPSTGTAWYRIGETAYMLRDLKAAREAFETFTANYPKHKHLDTAWPYLGDVCLGLQDLDKARSAYEHSLEADPEGRLADRARFGLGRALLLQGKPDEALGYFTALATRGGRDWADRAWLQGGLAHAKAGRDDKAVEAFEEVEKVAPKSPLVSEARLNRAEALTRLGRTDEAEPLLRALVAEAPQNLAGPSALAHGNLLLQKKDAAGALATFDDAAKRFARTPMAAALLCRSAEAALQLGQKEDALARFLRASESDPPDTWAEDALIRAARLTLDLGDFSAASKLADTFLSRFPNSTLKAEARLVSARAALKEDKPKDAITILKASLAEDKPSPATAQALTYYLGLAYGNDNQSEKLIEVLDAQAKTSSAPAADAQFLIGRAHMEAGRYAEAIAPLEAYLKNKPDGDVADTAYAHLIHAKVELGELDAAVETLGRLAERFPKSKSLGAGRVRVAEAALAAKQFDRAAEQFRLATEAPEPLVASRARMGLGYTSLESGKPDEAAAAFGAYLAVTPKDDPLAPEATLAQARALEAAKKTDEALEAYGQTARNFPRSEEGELAAIARAHLLAELKRPLDAATAYGEFIESHPDYKPNTKEGAGLDALLADWGWALVDAEKSSEADKVFSRLLTEFPESHHAADARFNLAESANQAKKYAEVVKLLEPLTAEGASTPPRLIQSALYRLGRTQAETKNWAPSAKALDRLLTEFPETSFLREAKLLRAEVALEQDDPQTADTILTALADLPADPKAPEGFALAVRRRKIQTLLGLKKWDEVVKAAESYKAEAAKDPLLSEVEYARGRALQQLGRMDDARAAYQAVVDARKGADLVARAQFMIGETYYHQENYHEAIRQYLKVDILYDAPPWQAASLLETGKAYERLAQWTDAAESYERLRAKFPSDPSAEKAKERLQAIQEHLKGDAKSSD